MLEFYASARNQDDAEEDDASVNSDVTNAEDEEDDSVVPVTHSSNALMGRRCINKGTGVYFNNMEVTKFLHPLQEMSTSPPHSKVVIFLQAFIHAPKTKLHY